MENLFLLEAYQSVGSIRFSMTRKEVENLFESIPEYENVDFLGRTNLSWGAISVKINKKDRVEEVTFSHNNDLHVFWNDIDILNDSDVVKKLNKNEKPANAVGFKIYFSLGIALTGVGKIKEDRVLSVFSKDLIKQWQSLVNNSRKKSVISSGTEING